MRISLPTIRSHERPQVWASFAVLLCLIGSHALLETARDALFLSALPAAHLPWVYLSVTVLSLLVGRIQDGVDHMLPDRFALSLRIIGAAAVTLSFWALLPRLGVAGLYALYVWSGLITVTVLVHFWTLLGDLFTVTQAKRLFGLIGAGSVSGAIVGSGMARMLAGWMDARHLILAAALGLGVAAGVALRLVPPSGQVLSDPTTTRPSDALRADLLGILRQPYARHVLGFVTLAAMTLMFADYLFKSLVAEALPADELGAFFGSVYLVLNILSLIAQLGFVSAIVSRLGVSRALALLPLLIVLGGVSTLLFGGVAAALLIKGPDGTLRYSLHKTASELLYVPLSERVRARAKVLAEVVCHKGGQGLASLLILLVVGAGGGTTVIAVVLLVSAMFWIISANALHKPYLMLFRRHLERDRTMHLDSYPELDMASLETLIAAMDSRNDDEVIAAMEVLIAEHRAHLIPALLLYHPSNKVVLRALDLFANMGRPHLERALQHLLRRQGEPRLWAATMDAALRLGHNIEPWLETFEGTPPTPVTVTLQAHAMLRGELSEDAQARLLDTVHSDDAETALAFARVLSRQASAEDERILIDLASHRNVAVRNTIFEAMGRVSTVPLLPALIGGVADEQTRVQATRALLAFGDMALDALMNTLRDTTQPTALRRYIPEVVCRFEPPIHVATLLLNHMTQEEDGLIRYRIIQAVTASLRKHPDHVLPAHLLRQPIDRALRRAYRYIDQRLTLERGGQEVPARRTEGQALLIQLLNDKLTLSIDRLLRLLGLVYAREDFDAIRRGLLSQHRETKASGLELLDNVLSQRLREPVLGLLNDLDDAARLSAGTSVYRARKMDYPTLLEQLLRGSSDTLRDFAIFHVGELRLVSLRPVLEALTVSPDVRPDLELALQRLDDDTAQHSTLRSA